MSLVIYSKDDGNKVDLITMRINPLSSKRHIYQCVVIDANTKNNLDFGILIPDGGDYDSALNKIVINLLYDKICKVDINNFDNIDMFRIVNNIMAEADELNPLKSKFKLSEKMSFLVYTLTSTNLGIVSGYTVSTTYPHTELTQNVSIVPMGVISKGQEITGTIKLPNYNNVDTLYDSSTVCSSSTKNYNKQTVYSYDCGKTSLVDEDITVYFLSDSDTEIQSALSAISMHNSLMTQVKPGYINSRDNCINKHLLTHSSVCKNKDRTRLEQTVIIDLVNNTTYILEDVNDMNLDNLKIAKFIQK